MSKTDNKVLDQILSQKKAELAPDMSDAEYFEIFVSQHVLRAFTLDSDEIQSGLVDGAGDGGIDAIYLIVNGRLIREIEEAEDLKALKQNVQVDLIVIQASTETSFNLKRIIRLKDTAEDILTLDRPPSQFSEEYNQPLLDAIERFRIAHKALATKYPALRRAVRHNGSFQGQYSFQYGRPPSAGGHGPYCCRKAYSS